METEFYNAIWDMIASGNSPEDIIRGAETIDFEKLVEEVEEDYNKVTED